MESTNAWLDAFKAVLVRFKQMRFTGKPLIY